MAQPIFPGNTGLAQEADQQVRTDVAPVRIGYGQAQVVPGHKKVSSSREWAHKSKLAQSPNEVGLGDGSQPAHDVKISFGTWIFSPSRLGTS